MPTPCALNPGWCVMEITAIIQARMGSTRLPGKSMLPLAGIPLIQHVVQRVQAASAIHQTVVATTEAAADDPLAAFLAKIGVPVFRGDENNVLKRYADAARYFGGHAIVRVTGDDPLKDPLVLDQVIARFIDAGGACDYVSNNNPPTFPEGMDVEIFSTEALLAIEQLATTDFEREHVTAYFYRHSDQFRCLNVANSEDLSHHRWTLDTREDLDFFQAVLKEFNHSERVPNMQDVLALLGRKPELTAINAHVRRSACYQSLPTRKQ